jgi:hexosaminidase
MTGQPGIISLDSDWAPSGDGSGTLALTLTNGSGRSLTGFRLAFTSHYGIDRQRPLDNATVCERLSTYHVVTPPSGLTLPPGARWTFSGISYGHAHYTSGPRSAYLIGVDGEILPVATTPTTRNREGGAPRLDPWPPSVRPETAPPVAILPFPLSVKVEGRRDPAGALSLAQGPPEAARAWEAAMGLAGRLFPSAPPLFARAGTIVCTVRQAEMAAESYRIDFAHDGVAVQASGGQGFLYGFVTLAQMLHGARQAPDAFAFPVDGTILDKPRLSWRGMLVDVARQVFSIDDLLRATDCLAWHKLNRCHLHLTDDEGWRLDIPSYPQLAEIAAWRGHGLALPPQLGSAAPRHGMVYGRGDINRLVQRAGELFVTLVPEIELPGHSYAALCAIPELRDPGETGIYRSVQDFPNNALNPAVPATRAFVETVLGEVARLFPSHFIHVGADEVPSDAWRGSPLAQQLMRARGWHAVHELQAGFLQQVQEMLRGLGRGLGAWEEAALGGGVGARDTYLVAWHEAASGIAVAQQGYDVVLSPGRTYYLDMAQSDDWWEPGASWGGTITPERCYAFDPGGDWPQDLLGRLLGVQACLWTEPLFDRRLFDHLTFPRLSAVAESAWTASAHKDFARFCAVQRLMPRTGIG